MTKFPVLILSLSSLLIVCTKGEASYVVEQPSTSGSIGSAIGKALAESLGKDIEERKQEAKRREEEGRQEVMRKEEIRRLQELAGDFIAYYKPENHAFCIATVLQSDLEPSTKMFIVSHLEERHAEWLKQKEKVQE